MASEATDEPWQEEHLVATIAAHRVLARDGSSVRLRQAWAEKTVVQLSLRQFGCLFCHKMVADILDVAPAIEANGGHVVLVGCGTLEQGLRFARAKGIPRNGVELYCDPGRDTYQAAGFERGYAKTFFNTDSRRAYAIARKEGHRITGVAGDLAQLGGVMVIAPPARLLYLHRSRFAGDHPDVDAVTAAVAD